MPLLVQQQVRRLDVAVDHALCVGVLQPLGRLEDAVHRLATGSGPCSLTSAARSLPSTYSITRKCTPLASSAS